MSDEVFKIDQFTVIGDIAAGQVSDVFEVIEDGTGKNFALKLIREEILNTATEKSSKTILSQFKQEFKLGQLLEHPNLVQVYEMKFKAQTLLPVKDPIAYFTMDHFRSQNLKVAATHDPEGTQRQLQKMLEQICEALGYVHSQGWVHRDIKPDNLLLTKSSEARLIDFSLACKIKKKHSIIQGTRTYIAPETIKKQRAVPQTDMYSLGVTLYEVLAGQPPFTGSSPTDLLKRHLATKPPPPSLLNDNVAPELDRLVLRLMGKTPADRFESMEDLVAEIRNTRFFLEETEEPTDEGADEEDIKSLVKTLDSRADAARSKLFAQNPELAQEHEEKQKAEEARRAKTKADQALAVQNSSKSTETAAPAPTAPAPAAPAVAPQPMAMPGITPAAMMPGMQGMPMGMPGMPVAPMMPPPGVPMAPMMPPPGMLPMPGTAPIPGAIVPGMPPAVPGMPPAVPGMPPAVPGMPPAAPGMPPAAPGMPAAAPGMPPAAPGMPPAAPGMTPAAPGMPAAVPGIPPAAPGMPAAPGSPVPGGAGGAMPLPGQPAVPASPAPQASPPEQPTPGAPAPQPPLPAAGSPAPTNRDDDLPLMEELPEIE